MTETCFAPIFNSACREDRLVRAVSSVRSSRDELTTENHQSSDYLLLDKISFGLNIGFRWALDPHSSILIAATDM